MKLDSIVFELPDIHRGLITNTQKVIAQDLYDYISTHDIFNVYNFENNTQKTLHKVFLCAIECAEQMFVFQKHTKYNKVKHILKNMDRISKALNENIVILKAERTDDDNAKISIIYETDCSDNNVNSDNSGDSSDEDDDE